MDLFKNKLSISVIGSKVSCEDCSLWGLKGFETRFHPGESDEMAIPGFLQLALKTLECEAIKAAKDPAKRQG